MKLSAHKPSFDFSKKDTVVVFLAENHIKNRSGLYPDGLEPLVSRANLALFKGKAGENAIVPLGDTAVLIFAGLGKRDEVSIETLRNSAAGATELCKRKRIRSFNLFVPSLDRLKPTETVRGLAEGICLANYIFNRYKSRSEDTVQRLESCLFHIDSPERYTGILNETALLCENTLLCRDLVNETSDQSNPLAIAREAKKLSRLKGVRVRVYGKRDIERMKMGLFQAVSRGGSHPPQLVVLKYNGNPNSRKYFAVIGKGITFDSGGLNLKPTGHIEDMRCDMAGAAVSMYTLKAAAEMKLKKNLYAVMPLCENMLSRNSYRPGDVHRAMNGKTVEIGNTDAEGRLILADALSFTETVLKPSHMIDIATLTGACLVAFGEIIAAMLTPDDDMADRLFGAGEATGERLWRMPLYKEYQEDLKSDIADIRNIGTGRNAGTIIGATFLKNFVKNTPWLHLDIAGTAWFSKQRGYRPKNATGFGVRLLIEVLKNIPQE